MYNDVDVYIHVALYVIIHVHVHVHVYELVSVQNQLDGCLTLCTLPRAHEKTSSWDHINIYYIYIKSA